LHIYILLIVKYINIILAKYNENGQARRMRWSGLYYAGERNVCMIGKPEGNRQLGRPINRWEGNIKMDLGEIRWGMDSCHLDADRGQWWALGRTAVDLRFP
jgi:hypothetical protein